MISPSPSTNEISPLLSSNALHPSQYAPREPKPNCYIPHRYVAVLLMHLGFSVLYMLRTNLSVAILQISEEENWDDNFKGLLLSAFFWGYITTQLLGGWFSNQFGGKNVLSFALLASACLTAVLPFTVQSKPLVMACRIATGVFSAPSFPTVHALISRWIPQPEVSTTVSIIWAGCYLGTIYSDLLVPIVINAYNWEASFYLFGIVTVGWWLIWQVFASNSAETSYWTSNYEKQLVANSHAQRTTQPSAYVPWKQIFSSMSVWAIIVVQFCCNWSSYILLTWIPTYFKNALGFSLQEAAWLAMLPYIALAVASPLLGLLADFFLSQDFDRTKIRKIFQSICCVGQAACLVCLCFVDDRYVSVGLMVLTAAFQSFQYGGFAPNILDVMPEYAGVILGISNTTATIPGIFGVMSTGFILNATNNWSIVFFIAAGVHIVGFLFYVIFGTARPIDVHRIN